MQFPIPDYRSSSVYSSTSLYVLCVYMDEYYIQVLLATLVNLYNLQ